MMDFSVVAYFGSSRVVVFGFRRQLGLTLYSGDSAAQVLKHWCGLIYEMILDMLERNLVCNELEVFYFLVTLSSGAYTCAHVREAHK